MEQVINITKRLRGRPRKYPKKEYKVHPTKLGICIPYLEEDRYYVVDILTIIKAKFYKVFIEDRNYVFAINGLNVVPILSNHYQFLHQNNIQYIPKKDYILSNYLPQNQAENFKNTYHNNIPNSHKQRCNQVFANATRNAIETSNFDEYQFVVYLEGDGCITTKCLLENGIQEKYLFPMNFDKKIAKEITRQFPDLRVCNCSVSTYFETCELTPLRCIWLDYCGWLDTFKTDLDLLFQKMTDNLKVIAITINRFYKRRSNEDIDEIINIFQPLGFISISYDYYPIYFVCLSRD